MTQPAKADQSQVNENDGAHSLESPVESEPESTRYECDSCGRPFDGAPESSGLFLWTRGEEVRYEEPPLCGDCAERISAGAWFAYSFEDEEDE